MKRLLSVLVLLPILPALVTPAFADAPQAITDYTNNTLGMITAIAAAASALFIIIGGYFYFTSNGKPEQLEKGKRILKNTFIGLAIVFAAGVIVSTLTGAFNPASVGTNSGAVNVQDIQAVKPSDGLTQVLIDAVSGFLQNVVQSATKPVMNGIIGYLTSTPSLMSNSVVLNFWKITVGIVDVLFVLVVALLGLRMMSAEALGFEEVELRQILPRIGLAFVGANMSLFLADFMVQTCNTLVKAILDSTGGLNQAFVTDAVNPTTLLTGTTPLITLVFLVLFLVVSIVLLFMYISRLIFLSLGAVLAPFIFLLWTLPKFADFAEIAVKSYLVTVFMIFVHVVVIQLASSFLALPTHTDSSIVSIAVAIGLFLALLKIPQVLMQMVFYTSGVGSLRRIGGHLINVISTDNTSSASRATSAVKKPRKVVHA